MGLWLRRFVAARGKLCNNRGMYSAKNFSSRMRRGQTRSRATRGAFEAVKISSGLIAFYPVAIHRPQPYVILLDPTSGILKRLDLQAAK